MPGIDYYVVYDETGAESSRHGSRSQAETAARRLVESGKALRTDVYAVLPNFGIPPHDVETRLASFGVVTPEPLFPAGPPRRERTSALAERQSGCLA